MESQDFTAAVHLLEPLCYQGEDISTVSIRSSIGRIYLQSGNMRMAAKHFTVVADDPAAEQTMKDMNAALLASAEGDWTQASEYLENILQQDADNFMVRILVQPRLLFLPAHPQAVNNLSVALLSQGKLKEVIVHSVSNCYPC